VIQGSALRLYAKDGGEPRSQGAPLSVPRFSFFVYKRYLLAAGFCAQFM
jgi:hypothetical protein